MQPDLEYLIWLYSIGLEEVLNEEPASQFDEKRYNNFKGKTLQPSIVTEEFIQQKKPPSGR